MSKTRQQDFKELAEVNKAIAVAEMRANKKLQDENAALKEHLRELTEVMRIEYKSTDGGEYVTFYVGEGWLARTKELVGEQKCVYNVYMK